jgi:hypothetical protein
VADLSLNNTSITDAGLALVKDWNNLRNLSLDNTSITDAGLALVKDWNNLRSLRLNGTETSDAGLALIKDCKNLQHLDVQNTMVSAAGLETLKEKRALPVCRIYWNGGEIVPHPFAVWQPAAHEKIVAAQRQFEAVARRLRKLNPRMDSRFGPTIHDAVIGLAFNTDQVSDLSPLRWLTRLESLICAGSPGRQGMLKDLSPLRGLPLKTLFCANTNVADLSPLKGMKLKILNCENTLVSDLTPLRGMALESLSVVQCGRVTDLAPLRGMPLKQFWSAGSAVSDLSPLRGMPLKELSCDFQRERDAALLRSLTTLEKINGKPAAEFWKEVDGK